MINLFDIINPNFFGILSSRNKITNFILINEISKYFSSQITVERKKLIDFLSNEIALMHIESLGDDTINQDTIFEEVDGLENKNIQKATIFITCLEKRGWLERDRTEEFVDIDSRTDAFLEIYDSLIKLINEETDAKEQSTSLLSLYRNVKDFDYKNATSSIEAIESSSKQLEKSILSINSKIKRFVEKTMSDVSLDENELARRLTVDYQKLSAYISFHNLLTKNNPSKYSITIINKIYELKDEEILKQLVDDFCETKNWNKEDYDQVNKAKKYIQNIFDNVLDQIENIEKSLSVISGRNYSYTASSVDRVNFRLNNERDIKGDINNVLKKIKFMSLNDEFDSSFDIYSFKQFDDKSLFTARALIKYAPKEVPFVKHEVSKSALLKAQQLIKEREQYSIESINIWVKFQLATNPKLNVSQFEIKTIEDLVKMMLVPVYSVNSKSIYKVSKLKNKTFEYLDYEIDDFIVTLKEGSND